MPGTRIKILDDDDLAWLAKQYSFTAAGDAYTSLPEIEKAGLHLKLTRGQMVNDERAAFARSLFKTLSRTEYESAYQEIDADAEPRPDTDLVRMAGREGEKLAAGQYDRWPLFDRMLLALDVQRGRSAIAEGIKPAQPKPRTIPEMCGQLWEECERCGREPVYQPLFLCEECWPKAA